MPRVKALAKNYIEPKLSETLGSLLFNSKLTQADIANELGISQPAVSKKLHTGNLSAREMIIILHMAEADESVWNKISRIY